MIHDSCRCLTGVDGDLSQAGVEGPPSKRRSASTKQPFLTRQTTASSRGMAAVRASGSCTSRVFAHSTFPMRSSLVKAGAPSRGNGLERGFHADASGLGGARSQRRCTAGTSQRLIRRKRRPVAGRVVLRGFLSPGFFPQRGETLRSAGRSKYKLIHYYNRRSSKWREEFELYGWRGPQEKVRPIPSRR